MIPTDINRVNNIPRRGYYLKKEFNKVTVYFDATKEKFLTEISIDNFFELLDTTTFSKGVAHSNLLIFIEVNDEIKLVNKNSKEHKKAMKDYLKISEIPLKKKISFLSDNSSYVGYYLGEGLNSDNKKSHFFELENKILCSNKINRIVIIDEDKKFTPNFTKEVFSLGHGFRNVEEKVYVPYHIEYIKEKNQSLIKYTDSLDISTLIIESTPIHSLSAGELFVKDNSINMHLGSIIPNDIHLKTRCYIFLNISSKKNISKFKLYKS